MKSNEVLILIPARKNSKGIKNKNIVKINKKPLIEYTLDSIKKSKLNIKKSFIVSDDKRVKNIANKYGVNTDYIRPRYLSKDKTLFKENLMHFYKWLKYKSIHFKYIMILQPTSPMRSSKDINLFFDKLVKKKPNSMVSISDSLEFPQETVYLKDRKIKFYLKNLRPKRRQDYNHKSYFINGAIYGVSLKNLEKNKFLDYKDTTYYIMDKINSFDLNDHEDLRILKKMMKN